MPRIRSIKPDFFKDEDIAELPAITRLLYIGLWCYADKGGRLELRPNYFRIEILPYDNVDIAKEIELLCQPKKRTGIPFILKYEVDGITYLQIAQWLKHQQLHKSNEADSMLPEPPESVLELIHYGRTTVADKLNNGIRTVGKGVERKGKEGKGEETLTQASELIEYLNAKAGTKFNPKDRSVLREASARLSEKYDIVDMKAVVDHKTGQWKNNSEMREFLRPSTLFAKKHMGAYIGAVKSVPKRRSDGC